MEEKENKKITSLRMTSIGLRMTPEDIKMVEEICENIGLGARYTRKSVVMRDAMRIGLFIFKESNADERPAIKKSKYEYLISSLGVRFMEKSVENRSDFKENYLPSLKKCKHILTEMKATSNS